MRKRNYKQKDLSCLQQIKFFGIFFIVVAFAFLPETEMIFYTLFVSVISITILCLLVYSGMDLSNRHIVKSKEKSDIFKPIFDGFLYAMVFIFKSMYFHLRTRIIFIINIIIFSLPMIGLFYGWTANDFKLSRSHDRKTHRIWTWGGAPTPELKYPMRLAMRT